MAGRLEDEGGHGNIRSRATGQQVQRADDVHLVRAARVHVEGIDSRERVYDRVDADRTHQLADQRVADVELQVIGAPEVVAGLADVDADDLGDARVIHQALNEQCAPPPR